MDLTPEYVKMCRKASEIQRLKPSMYTRNPNVPTEKSEGDFFRCGFCYHKSIDCTREGTHYDVWLPRQDQLQGLVGTENIGIDDENLPFCFNLMWDFTDFMTHLPYPELFNSIEKLWLAFLMKRRFSKVWNPEKKKWDKA